MRSRHMQIIVLVKQSLHSHLVKKIIAIVTFMFVYVVLLVKAERTYGKHNIRDLSEILTLTHLDLPNCSFTPRKSTRQHRKYSIPKTSAPVK